MQLHLTQWQIKTFFRKPVKKGLPTVYRLSRYRNWFWNISCIKDEDRGRIGSFSLSLQPTSGTRIRWPISCKDTESWRLLIVTPLFFTGREDLPNLIGQNAGISQTLSSNSRGPPVSLFTSKCLKTEIISLLLRAQKDLSIWASVALF